MRRSFDGVVPLTAPIVKLSMLGSVSSASGGSSTLKEGTDINTDETTSENPVITGITIFFYVFLIITQLKDILFISARSGKLY